MKGPKTLKLEIGVIVGIVLVISLISALPVSAKNMFTRTFIVRPLSKCDGAKGIGILDEMKQHGYNGWLMDASKLWAPQGLSASCKTAYSQVVAHAKKLGIALIPMMQQQNELSYTDLNYGEAYLSKGSKFVISGGKAVFQPAVVAMTNSGFDGGTTGWSVNSYFSIDKSVKRNGSSSIRAKDPTKSSVFIRQAINVKPNTSYEVSVYIKTQNMSDPRGTGLGVQAGGGWLHHWRIAKGVKPTQNWTVNRISFNSLNFTKVTIAVTATEYNKSTGTAWFDDVNVREVALYEAVMRNSTQPVVKSADGKTTYKAGPDYGISVDPNVKANNQGSIVIPAGSAIKNGEVILVDWYKLANGVTAMPPSVLLEQPAWTILENNVKAVDQLFDTPVARMMKYSEWRISGWDPGVQTQYKNTGDYWANVIKRTEQVYRKAYHNREVYIWNDEVDPYHNGEKSAAKIWNGNHRAWKGLTEETIVVNWNAHDRLGSMRFFAGRDPKHPEKKTMQRQILSPGAFKPNDGNGGWNDWLSKLTQMEKEGLPDGAVIGVNYHTFTFNYTELADLKNACTKAGRWAPIFPFKPNDVSVAPFAVASKSAAHSISISHSMRGRASIQYGLEFDADVKLNLVNAKGRTVKTLVEGKRQSIGRHTVRFDASDMSSGVYFVNLDVDGGAMRLTKKMVVF